MLPSRRRLLKSLPAKQEIAQLHPVLALHSARLVTDTFLRDASIDLPGYFERKEAPAANSAQDEKCLEIGGE
jgi:hypothetical protein